MMFPNLFSPLTIRGKTFKNRILLAPKGYPTPSKDEMSRSALDFYRRIAAGGVARVVTSECDVQYGSAVFGTYNMFLDPLPETLESSMRRYGEICHEYGALAFVHFGHMGAYCRDEEYNERMRALGKIPSWRPPQKFAVPQKTDGTPYKPVHPMGPCEMDMDEPYDGVTASLAYDLNDGKHVFEMTRQDMEDVANAFARCARNAKQCGLDGMSIHSGHGFIFSQWISPRFNRRTDEFGGSMENRARFPILCLKRIREAVGEDFIVEMRFSAEEHIDMISNRAYLKDLVTREETVAFFRELDKHPGLLDIAHITGGLHFVPYYNTRSIPNNFFPMAPNLEAAAAVKAAVKNIKVGCVGAMADPVLCEEAIAQGKTDFVIMARQLCVADPEFPNKAMRGELSSINNCLRCTICCRSGRCSVNPMDVKTDAYDQGIPKAAQPWKIAVVGGGIAGMKAAEYAALAGHQVTLFEKTEDLGGVLRYADKDDFKADIRRYCHAVRERIRNMDICIRTNEEVTPESLKAFAPDAVILAVGAEFRPLEIPGGDSPQVIDCVSCYLHPEEVRERIVIIGGGLTACETAIHFAYQGRDVSLVCRSKRLMQRVTMVGPANGSTDTQLIRLDSLGVKAYTGCVPVEIGSTGVTIRDGEGAEMFLPADTVINAIGLSGRPSLADAFGAGCQKVIPIGDCTSPANIGEAVTAAYEAVLSLSEE